MDKLPEFKIKLGGDTEYTYDIQQQLEVDSTDIGDDLRDQPSKYAWFATIYELAKAYREDLSIELEELYAKLYEQIVTGAGKVKSTETAIKQSILRDLDYSELRRKVAIAKQQAGLLQKHVRAFEQRKDVIMALNANEREEKRQF